MWDRLCFCEIYKNILPPEAEIITLEDKYKTQAITAADVDKDGIEEIILAYRWKNRNHILVLKNCKGFWRVIENKILKENCKTYFDSLHSVERTVKSPYPSKEKRIGLEGRIESRVNSRKDKLYPASIKTKNGTKWGYINKNGEFIINPIYDYAQDSQENGLAVVEIDNLQGLINNKGEYIIKPKYGTITEFSEGRAAVVDEEGFKVINEAGEELTSKPYSFIGRFSDGRALFSGTDKNGKYLYGYLNRDGKEVISLTYETGSDYKDGKAIVKLKENNYELIDVNGNVINSYNYEFVGNMSEGLLVFQEKPGDKYGFIDEKGNVIIPPKFSSAQPFSQGRAVVNMSEDYLNAYGLIDRSGSFIIKPQYNDIIILGEDRVAVGEAIKKDEPYIGSKYAIADTNGTFLTDFLYYGISEYANGVASAYDDKYTFFIDKKEEMVKDLPKVEGSGILTIDGDIIKAVVDYRTYYLDKSGKIVWKQNSIIPLDKDRKIQEVKYKPNKDYLVYYPQLQGINDKYVEKQVNDKLAKLSSLKEVEPNKQLDYSYLGDFSVEFFKDNILVLELDGYEYYFGAAHGMPSRVYPAINLVTGEFYELKDLFKENSDYVKVISDIIGQEIKNNSKYSYVFPDTYKGIKANQPFYVDEEALYIYFAPYEIAPYAAGFPTFKIPFKDIADIVNTNGSFWRAFHNDTFRRSKAKVRRVEIRDNLCLEKKKILDNSQNIDFSQVKFVLSETERDLKLEKAVKENYDISGGNVNYYYNHIDLNGDNIPETFVYLSGPAFCGSGGCCSAIFKKEDEEYKLLSKLTLVNNPIVVTNNVTKGYKDLVMYVRPPGTECFLTRVEFDGEKYPLFPCYKNKLPNGTKIEGTAIISDDLSKNPGIPLK